MLLSDSSDISILADCSDISILAALITTVTKNCFVLLMLTSERFVTLLWKNTKVYKSKETNNGPSSPSSNNTWLVLFHLYSCSSPLLPANFFLTNPRIKSLHL